SWKLQICSSPQHGIDCGGIYTSDWHRSTGWRGSTYYLPRMIADIDRENAQRIALLQFQQRKQNIRNKFLAENNAETLVNAEQLQRNPFPYKGKVVGVFVIFGRMTSENTAIFNRVNPEMPVL